MSDKESMELRDLCLKRARKEIGDGSLEVAARAIQMAQNLARKTGDECEG